MGPVKDNAIIRVDTANSKAVVISKHCVRMCAQSTSDCNKRISLDSETYEKLIDILDAFDGKKKTKSNVTEEYSRSSKMANKQIVANTNANGVLKCHTCDGQFSVKQRNVQCTYCDMYYHVNEKCTGLAAKNYDFLHSQHILYVCRECIQSDRKTTKEIEEIDTKFNSKLNEVQSSLSAVIEDKLEDLFYQIENKVDQITQETYASKVKGPPKPKNTLVIKATNDNETAAKDKVTIVKKMDTHIDHAKTTRDGHVIVSFPCKETLDRAKSNLNGCKDDLNITVHERRKLWPKIKVCNVSTDDENVIHSILERNDWLKNAMTNEEDLKFCKELKSKNRDEKHCIIKCSPEIRKRISENGDYLYTLFSKNKVYDSYRFYQCYHCQKFDHSSRECRHRQACANCGGEHRSDECTESVLSCVNCCARNLKSDHRANDLNCPRIKEEIARIKNRTDHGV